jgi:tetratricopeptide (TPR) repeat protein
MKKILFVILISFLAVKNVSAQNTPVADSLFKAEQWEKAAAAYDQYIKEHPNDMPGLRLNRIGQCYFNIQQFDKAITTYKKAVVYNSNPNIMYNIACAYSRLSKNDSALAWLNNSATAGFNLYDGLMQDEDMQSLKKDPQFITIAGKIKKNQMPCSAQPESHLFDFWIGDWKVYNPQGQQAGTSKIEQILGECVIQENWTDYFGGKGKSINTYNASAKEWQQTWVNDKGGLTEFINGEYKDGAMRFASSRPQITNGKTVYRRLTFFNTNANEVRQLGEISNDLQKTWKVEYDFKYVRAK